MATIVLVDDSLGDRRLFRAAISKRRGEAVSVLGVSSGIEGIEAARFYKPSAIVVDLDLPGLDGAEVLAELKGTATTAAIPVIMLTGDPTRRDELLAQGAAAYVVKSADLFDLADNVLRACGL